METAQIQRRGQTNAMEACETMTREDAIRTIERELDAALEQWPAWPADPVHAAAVIAEETGELVQACLDFTYALPSLYGESIRKEAAQVGAMAIRMLMHLDQYQPRQSEPAVKP